jgi:hypothetical protein
MISHNALHRNIPTYKLIFIDVKSRYTDTQKPCYINEYPRYLLIALAEYIVVA